MNYSPSKLPKLKTSVKDKIEVTKKVLKSTQNNVNLNDHNERKFIQNS
jgi:hypothetical protein